MKMIKPDLGMKVKERGDISNVCRESEFNIKTTHLINTELRLTLTEPTINYAKPVITILSILSH